MPYQHQQHPALHNSNHRPNAFQQNLFQQEHPALHNNIMPQNQQVPQRPQRPQRIQGNQPLVRFNRP